VVFLLWGLLAGRGAFAQPLDLPLPGVASPAGAAEAEAVTLSMHNRKIVTFRSELLGDTPAERVQLAQTALQGALAGKGQGVVTRTPLGDSVRFEVDGQTVFFLVTGDVGRPRPEGLLDATSREVMQRLQTAVQEAREMQDPMRLAKGFAYAAGATVLAFLLARFILVARRRVTNRWYAWLDQRQSADPAASLVGAYHEHAQVAGRMTVSALAWVLLLMLLDAWVTYVLHQFAWTRPWAERSTAWLLGMVQQIAVAMIEAVPGLIVAVLIFVIARTVSRANALFLERVERGDTRLSWLDADTAVPTRRLSNFVIWLFALAMAYPYLPGADTEAFKALSVIAGLMLSLGASSVVGQALSGLSLMYSRSLRVGEYVKIGETEGTVTTLGMFTTKVHTGMGEEVSLPNTVIFNQPIRNFSRLVSDGRFMLQTVVTIGYATPWRQVHAMLLEAARRTAGVAAEPLPYVVQTALSDFYVEYRLCAQSNKHAPARRAEVMNLLHANIQDVFNENGVQIMSPHYMADPPEPQVVPPGPWASHPKRPQDAA
jgi:small-conductance mechanosensitive channel